MSDPTPPDSETDAGGDELLGRTLDERFRLDELVGEGGMGRVYRGCQLSVERDVAIKVLHGELTFDEELRERFFREAKVVSGLNHPNIVRLVDFGRDEETGLLYLAMEFIDGVGLDEVAELGRLEPELALRIAHQTCGALVEAHGAGVIHRDLKAENLILDPVSDGTFQTKVVDFGIAYPQDASRKLTMTGRVYGTASYMPPEQARGEEVDERADLFAVGVLMFEMLVGRLPIEGTSSMDVLIRQIRDGPPRLSQVVGRETFPQGVVELVDRLLAVEPVARPPDAAQVREHLEGIFEREGWTPLRLETGGEGTEMFEPWIAAPFELPDDEQDPPDAAADLRETTDRSPPPDAAADLRETADRSPPPDAVAVSEGAPPDGGGPPDDDSSGHRRLLVALAVLFGLFVVLGVAAGGYFAYRYLGPEADGLEEIARPAKGGERIEADGDEPGAEPAGGSEADRPSAADDDPAVSPASADGGTDPVCGEIDRPALPAAWRGRYRPQGDERDATLELSSAKLNARWEDAGGTVFIARGETSGRTYEVECARYAGSGDGDECTGELRRRGPVLTVDLDGSDACEQRISGTWLTD